MSNSRTTKRCAAAAAGLGMIIAGYAGAAASATAATTQHHSPASGRVHRDITTPSAGVTATVGAPVEIAVSTLTGGASVALPTVTVTDPGFYPSGETITLGLFDGGTNTELDTTASPAVTVSGSGATAGAVTVTTTSVSFTITKSSTAVAATYAVSGIEVVGAGADPGPLGIGLDSIDASIDPFSVAAITEVVPAAFGPTSPDTAGVLFDATVAGAPTAAVLASDYEPQDAESANYLAGALSDYTSPHTGILLTDPDTLSPAVTTALDAQPNITTVYIVGGTSVVSAAVAALLAENYTVIRLAGETAYDTDAYIVNYVAANLTTHEARYNLDYSQTQFNDTSGASSPTTTGVGLQKTAIVASGAMDSFQDGIVSGPLSDWYDGSAPVILTTPDSLSPTALSLLTQGAYKQVILLGGPSAVSDAVEAQLTASTADGGAGVTVFRIAGTDASDTSTKMAAFLTTQAADLNLTDDQSGGVLIARGTGFQDALVTGPYAGDQGYTPILLTENATTLGAPLAAYLQSVGARCHFAVQAVGGPLSVAPAVQQAGVDAEFSGLDISNCEVG